MTTILKRPYVEFVGSNANEVTGSANLVKFLDSTILVDYGLRQTSNDEEDYKINSKRHKDIKPKDLTAIIITHSHIDHQGLIPSLFKDGGKCPIYIPKGTKGLITLMWQDSNKIFESEYERCNRKPIYSQNDIDKALSYIIEVDLHEKVSINDNISFEYYNAQHIVKSRQIYMELNDGVNIKKLGFTGDFSSKPITYYLNDFEPLPQVNLLVGECTYSNNKRIHKSKDRSKDIDKLDMAIKYALEKKGKVLIPTFSLDRLQNILTVLYDMYEGKMPIKCIVCTPLGKHISDIWDKLIDKNYDMWNNVFNWEDIRWITEYKDMVSYSKINEPMLIIGSGGMLSGGTSVFWTKELLPYAKNRLVFCGYSTEESTAGKIKSGVLKEVKIDGTVVKNKAQITILNSFSSHADYNDLLNYYTTIPYTKIALVHSNFDDKLKFAETLKQRLSKANRTSKVIATNKDTKIHF